MRLTRRKRTRLTTKSHLSYRLKQLTSQDHVCLIYRSRQEQFQTAIPFISIGLQRGEKCIYIVDVNTPDEILAVLRKRGIDVESAVRSGALIVATKEETCLRSGAFHRDRMLKFWEEAIDSAIAAGFSALRVTGEVTRMSDGPGTERWLEYESKANQVLRNRPALALCQYDGRWLSPGVVSGVLQTHPLLVYGRQLLQSPCYIAPEKFVGLRRTHDQGERLLDRMRESARERKPLYLSESERKLLQSYLRVAEFRSLHGR